MDSGAWSGTNSGPNEDVFLGSGEVAPVAIPQSMTGRMGSSEPTGSSLPGVSVPVTSLSSADFSSSGDGNTLDEPVWDTVKRDLKRIGYNLKVVLMPGFAQAAGKTKALRDWDLWGPLVFTLLLAIALSVNNPKGGSTFSVVVLVVCLGAVVLTLNVVLLGGQIQFFQSVSLLGYCLFPLVMVAIISIFISNTIVRALLLVAALGWCFWAAIPFVSSSVPERRRTLAIYPVFLLYTFVSSLALTRR